jgi:hypothetical protein
MQKMRKKYSSSRKYFIHVVRSTLYVKYDTFDQYFDVLMKDYATYNAYKRDANTHPTFDVYSVGKMLSNILNDYFSEGHPKWMEVIERWKALTRQMTQLIPWKRITMDQALKEVRDIRHFLFG